MNPVSVSFIVELSAFAAGLSVMALVGVARRFGPGSWLLSLSLLVSSAVPGILVGAELTTAISEQACLRIAFSGLLLAAFLAMLFVWTIDREDYWAALKGRRGYLLALGAPLPVTIALAFQLAPSPDPYASIPPEFFPFGTGGYVAALHLLALTIIGLAFLEQSLRTSDDRVRWEIKFLVLGLGAIYVSDVYIASQVLLYPPDRAYLPKNVFFVFSAMLTLSCALIMASWHRSTGKGRIAFSQSLVYSSITLLGVGLYLVASSLVARWVSQWGEPGIQTEATVFIISIVFLAALLLWTSLRHRTRNWIRRHIYAGKYDYRELWMEATSQVRSTDEPARLASAVARIIRQSLGAIDVTVWSRTRDANRLTRLAAIGAVAETSPREMTGIVESLLELPAPLSRQEISRQPNSHDLTELMRQTDASLLAPLISSGRLVGLITVGADRSGQEYHWEAREFLRVLAAHAAGEVHKAELLETLMAAKESEAFRSFSTFLLHDLKNFASTLSLIARNAARHQDNPEFQKDAFQSVYDTAEKMKRLCNSLRTFSGTLILNKRKTDLNQVVRSAVDRFDASTPGQVCLQLAELPEVEMDTEEIDRMVQNLLLNANEAIDQEGVITVRTSHQTGSVELRVADTGCGMTREFLEKELFLPFHTTKSGGLGIGLFQCKKIVEAHGGTIMIESAEGRGTEVRIALPVTASVTEARPGPAPMPVSTESQPG